MVQETEMNWELVNETPKQKDVNENGDKSENKRANQAKLGSEEVE